MVDSGLYEVVLVPDMVFGQHVMLFKSGHHRNSEGPRGLGGRSFSSDAVSKGRTRVPAASFYRPGVDGGKLSSQNAAHPSPERRRQPPAEVTVITIGSIQAGMTENIIPDHAVVKIDIRTVTSEIGERVVAWVAGIIRAEYRQNTRLQMLQGSL